MQQYSRKKNLAEKDNNTRYFNAYATLRKKQNCIVRIKIRDQILTDESDIRKGIGDHFKISFLQEELPFIELPRGAFKQLPVHVVES